MPTTLGQNIKRLRERPGFERSRRELARAMGTEYQSVYDWESDRRQTVDMATLLKLARALQVTVELLLDGVDQDYEAVKRDLMRHAGDQESHSSSHVGDDSNDSAADRMELERLRSLVARYETEAREVRTATDAIVKVALRLEKIRKTSAAKPHGSSRDRKVG